MTSQRKQRRVVLIFGDPGNGKSYLAKLLREKHEYYLIELDGTYVEFVKSRYPQLYLPALQHVIAQHFDTMLKRCDEVGALPGAVASWGDHVASLAKDACEQHNLVAVEGYLLSPVLAAVQDRLAGMAVVITVEVRNRHYFVASSIEQIVGV